MVNAPDWDKPLRLKSLWWADSSDRFSWSHVELLSSLPRGFTQSDPSGSAGDDLQTVVVWAKNGFFDPFGKMRGNRQLERSETVGGGAMKFQGYCRVLWDNNATLQLSP